MRWTQPFAAGEWSASMENADRCCRFGAPLTAGSATPLRSDRDRYPDIIGRLKWKNPLGTFNAALMRAIFRIDSATAADAKWAKGSLSPRSSDRQHRRLPANFNAGNAIDATSCGLLPDGYVDATGKVRLPKRERLCRYRHFWSPMLRSSLILAASSTDTPGGGRSTASTSRPGRRTPSDPEPGPQSDLGMELIYEKRTVVDGDSGTLHRLQFAAQYFF